MKKANFLFNYNLILFWLFAAMMLALKPAAADIAGTIAAVASKDYVVSGFATKQNKLGGGASAGKVVIATATAGQVGYLGIDSSVGAESNNLPTSAAVADAIGNAIAGASGNYVPASSKAAAGGVAALDQNTKVPVAQLPTGTTSTHVASGNDGRFWSVPVGNPGGAAPNGWAAIYVLP